MWISVYFYAINYSLWNFKHSFERIHTNSKFMFLTMAFIKYNFYYILIYRYLSFVMVDFSIFFIKVTNLTPHCFPQIVENSVE